MLTLRSKKRSIITGFLVILISCTPLLAANRRSTNRKSRTARSQKQSARESRRSTRANRSSRDSKANSQIMVNVDKFRPRKKTGFNVNLSTNNLQISYGNRRHFEAGSKWQRRDTYRPAYKNRYRRRFSRRIRPRYVVTYGNPGFSFRYTSGHRRKHVFICLGGSWPIGYGHRRYFWYSYYPVTYNYYTYNYNKMTALPDPEQGLEPPGRETLADRFFDEGAAAFEAGNYYMASEKFARASELAPGDIIIPFAHVQTLFANEKYAEAAEILRDALMRISPDEQGIYFPRGLYKDEATLSDQINKLIEECDFYYRNSDLRLLLGYQLFGVNEIDEAIEVLEQPANDLKNAAAAEILLNLLQKYRK
jgi:tetratricopeptide (TPR) repeat protein